MILVLCATLKVTTLDMTVNWLLWSNGKAASIILCNGSSSDIKYDMCRKHLVSKEIVRQSRVFIGELDRMRQSINYPGIEDWCPGPGRYERHSERDSNDQAPNGATHRVIPGAHIRCGLYSCEERCSLARSESPSKMKQARSWRPRSVTAAAPQPSDSRSICMRERPHWAVSSAKSKTHCQSAITVSNPIYDAVYGIYVK